MAGLLAALTLGLLPLLARIAGDFDRCASLLFLPAMLVGGHVLRGKVDSPSARFDRGLLLIVIAVATASAFLSPHSPTSLVGVACWIWGIAIVTLFRNSASYQIHRLVFAAVAVSTAASYALISITWSVGTSAGQFPYYGHVRVFGLHMMIGALASLGWLAQCRPRSPERWLACCVAAISTAALLWSGGRTPVIGLLIGAAAWYGFGPREERRLLLVHLPLIFAAGLALSWLKGAPEPYLGWWGAVVRSRTATTLNELSSTRWQFWQVTWQHILQHPWLGGGADAYRFIVPRQDGDQPHNWILQFLLDFGFIGGTSAAVLLVRQALRGFGRNPELSLNASPITRRAAAAGLTGCLAAGLLDGVFYHAILLLPAMMFAGIAGQTPGISVNSIRPRVLWTIPLAVAALVLGIHNYLFVALVGMQPPDTPRAPVAQLLRHFPSTTAGLARWLDHWRPRYDAQVLEWAEWAAQHSDNAARFHLYTAVVHADHDDFAGADREMQAAIATCHWTARASLERFRESIAAAAPKQ